MRRFVTGVTIRRSSIATSPTDPNAPDPLRGQDGIPVPDDQPASQPEPEFMRPPMIEPGDPGDAPSDSPTQTQA